MQITIDPKTPSDVTWYLSQSCATCHVKTNMFFACDTCK